MRLFLEIIHVYIAPTFYVLSTAYIISVFFPNSRLNPMRAGVGENWPLPRYISPLIFFIIVLSIPLGIFMQGSWWQYGLALATVVWLIAPFLGLLGMFAIQLWIRGKRVPASLKRWALVLAACIAALALSCGIGTTFHRWQINAARAYVDHAAPVLDSIRTETGFYPETLPISTLGTPPRLLRETGSYNSNGKQFYFYYSDSTRPFGGREQFDSTSRTWVSDDTFTD